MKKIVKLFISLMAVSIMFCACAGSETASVTSTTALSTTASTNSKTAATEESVRTATYDFDNVPEFSDAAYVEMNNNIPDFADNELVTTSYESYGELDELGRCTVCIACIGQDIMPTEKRGEIGMIKPTGWHTVKYENVDGKYLYNRCHLIGYQLTAENANEKNLITGTRYLNVQGMLPFENEVDDYIEQTGNHVLYEVTPIFRDSELLARGVHMQAKSVEDNGEGVSFNVYCYNAQPGIEIDYATGESKAIEENNNFDDQSTKKTYIVNTNSKKFHYPTCSAVDKMSESNKKEYKGTRESLIDNGYSPCKICNP